jgi:hypothetical protein
LLLLAGLVAVAASVRAGDLAMSGNPYSGITERNVFALVPIPTNSPVSEVPLADPPPKITPNGIMSIFGKLQALFKVTPKPPAGQPAKDLSYVLAEGERQDEIEVVKIDGVKRIITFNNHGTMQELALVDAPKQTVPTPGPITGGANPGAMIGASAGGGVTLPAGGGGAGTSLLGRSKGRGGNAESGGLDPNALAQALTSATSGTTTQNKADELSPEAQVLMMEANRIATQELVDSGKMPPLPPTALTPADATAHNGSPLIAPNEPAPAAKK